MPHQCESRSISNYTPHCTALFIGRSLKLLTIHISNVDIYDYEIQAPYIHIMSSTVFREGGDTGGGGGGTPSNRLEQRCSLARGQWTGQRKNIVIDYTDWLE